MIAARATPLVKPDQASDLLDEVIYDSILELIDRPRLADFECRLGLELRRLGVKSAEIRPLARSLVERALARFATDAHRYDDDCAGCGPF